ncbi:sulfotransferase [Egicoccus sp. AB-alg2]|uniref:sulfotransferase n=1 Tax=Egicoccus sp. AB-alg2 TaxID=3242693 RepID=UPI00359CBF1B
MLLQEQALATAAVDHRLAALRERRARHAEPALCDEVRDLVVVCSSSRSGSSLLGELLRRSPELVTTSAETNPQFVVPVLGRGPDLLADPSPVCAAGAGREVVRSELSLDLGAAAPPTAPPSGHDLEVFADHVAWRLTMQWPREPIDPEHVRAVVADLGVPEQVDAAWFGRLLSVLRTSYPSLDARRYDLPAEQLPEGAVPADEEAPAAEPIVEMAPFVLPRRWRAATPAEVRTRPVVLVTPRNAFRLPLLASLFPAARLRVVHLVRNPAAAVNGLRAGWLHPDFVACRLPELDLDGYDVPPARRDEWSFDLPPHWRELTGRPLVEVCAEQWRSANEATIAAAADLDAERHVVRFEDVVGSPRRRAAALGALADHLGIAAAPLVDHHRLPVVMATEAPRPGRWRDNAAHLDPVLRDPAVRAMARRLGYGADPAGWH